MPATRWLVMPVLLLVAAGAMAAMVWLLWRPQHVLWANNAYGMTRVGAWEGWEGFGALLAYWFFTLKGRTVLTVVAVCAWGLAAWRGVSWCMNAGDEK